MSLQSQLDNELFEFIPKIHDLIKKAQKFESDQMQNSALREAMNTKIPVCNMNKKQIDEFEEHLMIIFKLRGLI